MGIVKILKRGKPVQMEEELALRNLENTPELFTLPEGQKRPKKVVDEFSVDKTDGSGADEPLSEKLLLKQKKEDLLLTGQEMGLKVNEEMTRAEIVSAILGDAKDNKEPVDENLTDGTSENSGNVKDDKDKPNVIGKSENKDVANEQGK